MSDELPLTLLLCNPATGEVLFNDSAWSPRALTFGEGMRLAFRAQGYSGDQLVDLDLDVRATKVSFGRLDERPAMGHFCLQLGEGMSSPANTTAALRYNCPPGDLAAAINALDDVVEAYGEATVRAANGSWYITFAEATAAVPMQLRNNELMPPSQAEMNAALFDGEWEHELRLTQAGLAFVSAAERVLPPPPTITGVQDGGTAGEVPFPEIQALYLPPAFRGTFYLRTATGARTIALSRLDTADTIQAALETVLGKGNVSVTDAADFTAHVAFVGELIGIDQELLEVEPLDPPPGDLTTTIMFDRWALQRRLRADAEVTELLEVTVYLGDALVPVTLVSQPLTVVRRLNRPELETTPEEDWLRPLSPVDYRPFSRETVLIAQPCAPKVIGDGTSTVFPLTDGLNTETKVVWVRENHSGGRQLVQGEDYSVTNIQLNTVTVTALGAAPGVNAWAAVIMSAQTVAYFANGLTVTKAQVTGLVADLAALAGRLTTLEAQAATTPLGVVVEDESGTPPWRVEIAPVEDAFPYVGDDLQRSGDAVSVTSLPRPGSLLPALHKASATSVTSALPSISAATGLLYVNNTAGAIILTGGGGVRHTASVPVGGFFSSDGRRLYPVTHAGTTTSYFPAEFEQTFPDFITPGEVLRAGTTLKMKASLAVQRFNATSAMQCVFVIEHGAAPSETSPATTSPNLQDIVWNATPLLTSRVIFGRDKTTAQYAVEVIRKANGDMAANQIKGGFRSGAGSVPAVGDVAIRARLINWDTQNSVAGAVGTMWWRFEASAEVTNG